MNSDNSVEIDYIIDQSHICNSNQKYLVMRKDIQDKKKKERK